MMETNKRITVVVASHKDYPMPEDPMYLPLYVGAVRDRFFGNGQNKETSFQASFARDDSGDNISALNLGFCELTGLYWAWKNLDAAYIGLVHYRRHFSMAKSADIMDSILKEEQISPYLGKIEIFVPKKRQYYIESLYSHYAHTHYAVQLDCARDIIAEKYPAFSSTYETVVKRTWGYMFNMMILTKEWLDDYCTWLFDILFAMKDILGVNVIGEEPSEEQKENMPVLSDFQSRFYGRVSEILFNVWLEQRIKEGRVRPEQIMELSVLNTEGENMGKKAASFLKAKFFGRKYEQSF